MHKQKASNASEIHLQKPPVCQAAPTTMSHLVEVEVEPLTMVHKGQRMGLDCWGGVG